MTSNLEERHIPMVESKTYPEEEEDEDSLENSCCKVIMHFNVRVPVPSKQKWKVYSAPFTFLHKTHLTSTVMR